MDNRIAIDKLDRTCRQDGELASRSIRILDPEKCTHWGSNLGSRHRDDPSSREKGKVWNRPILAGLEAVEGRKFVVTHPEVLTRLISTLGRLHEEALLLISLAADHTYLYDEVVAQGSRTGLAGNFRTIVETALTRNASAVALAHNHPSGSLSPSKEDLIFTRHVSALLSPLDITLVDHVIVTNRSALSLQKAEMT